MEGKAVMPALKFYGVKAKKRGIYVGRALEEQANKLKQDKRPTRYHSSILGPSTRWQIFFRQQDAFDFISSKTEDLHVFAFESKEAGNGHRQYLAASYPGFWHIYIQLEESRRHHYEVIPEGSPCKLYFDLEFHTEANPESNGIDMVNTLIKVVCDCLRAVYHVECSRELVLDLDATTITKFSRHLIFQMKNAVFKDNIHAGSFVRAVFSKMEEYLLSADSDVESPHQSKNLRSVDRSDDDHPKGLHSNQLDQASGSFPKSRTSARSSGKYANLLTESNNSTCYDKRDENSKEPSEERERPFVLDGSCCRSVFQKYTRQELQSLFVKDKNGRDASFADLGVYTKNRNFRLYKSCKLGKGNPFHRSSENTFVPRTRKDEKAKQAVFLSSLIANVSVGDGTDILTYSSSTQDQSRRKSSVASSKSLSQEDYLEGFSKSPYPEVDLFILGLVADEGRGGAIRGWTYFPQAEIISYDILGYRFCFNIQRQHCSNNIKLIVNLKRGVWYQKCHDPDCQAINFKSEEKPLPENTLPAHFFTDSDFEDEANVDSPGSPDATLDDFSAQETEEDAMCLAALEEIEHKLAANGDHR